METRVGPDSEIWETSAETATVADMADFTGVNESVPLGKKANKEAAKRLRTGMIDMIQDAEEEEEDEEAMEWEQAQIRRSEPRRTVETLVRPPLHRWTQTLTWFFPVALEATLPRCCE